MTIVVGLSLMVESDFRQAVEPLLTAGEVDALEWTLDIGWARRPEPWVKALLDAHAERGTLYGHGFSFSLLSGRWTPRHETWLKLLDMETRRRSYRHISEHFCFVTAGDFTHSAPMPVPLTDETLAMGQARMKRLAEAAKLPVGLENLAIAFGRADVDAQGQFLEGLLSAVDGFVLLDLHNLYCQIANFDLDAEALLATYPLERVRELHVSGGSWDQPSLGEAPFRRDTHDDAFPEAVFDLLELALDRCPHVEAVFAERIGGTITSEEQAERFRADYRRTRAIVQAHTPKQRLRVHV